MASNLNEQTISSYEKHMPDFFEKTPKEVTGPFKLWMDLVLSYLSPQDTILEIGSGTGRDAAYIESQGYTVHRSDATEAFIEYIQASGYHASKLNILTDDLGGPHKAIVANAVLLHFTRDEVATILKKIHASLADDGLFAFTVKAGAGEKWESHKMSSGRFFCYWDFKSLHNLVTACGFDIVAVHNDEAPSSANAKWIRMLIKKSIE